MLQVTDTPADAFEQMDEIRFFAQDLHESWVIDRSYLPGDVVEVVMDYIDPEGRQLDVDRFAATHERVEFELDFGEELPED
jgi:hypothetical protein